MFYLLIFLTALTFTIFLTPYLIKFLVRVNVVDIPGHRKIHSYVTPRMGGVLIYIVVIGLFIIYSGEITQHSFLILGSFLILICGVIDDLFQLTWLKKMMLQSLSALLLLFYFLPQFNIISIFSFSLPQPLGYIVLFIFILGTINSINLLDGMDGLVSSFSLIVTLVVLLLAVLLNNITLMIICAALAGSILGFLKFNAFPAKIFLGDSGSLILGYILTAIALMTSLTIKPGLLDLTFPVILLGLPIVDTLKVIAVRIVNKKSPMQADNHHIHHIMYGTTIRHKSTVFLIGFLTTGYAVISVYYYKYPQLNSIILFILFSMLLLFMQHILVKIRTIDGVRKKARLLLIIPNYVLTIFKKAYIPLSAVFVFLYLFSVVPRQNIMTIETLSVILVSCLVFLLLSFINKRRYQAISDIYVLFNIIIFIMLGLASNSLPYENVILDSWLTLRLETLCIGGLALLLIIFLLVREKIYPGKENFLNGFDLIVLVIISNFFFLSTIILPLNYQVIGGHLLQAFIIYLWYKSIIYINSNYALNLYYVSFALSVFITIFLFFI